MYTAVFPKKSGSFKNCKNVPEIKVFWILLKNGSNDLDEIHSGNSAYQFLSARENRFSKILVLDILRSEFDHSVGVMIPWAKKSLDMCYILLICRKMKMKLQVKAKVRSVPRSKP